jgi:predicted dehydrogenase
LTGQAAWRETFVAQATHFLDVLDRSVQPVQTFDDARRALAVIQAAYQSAASGTFVELP